MEVDHILIIGFGGPRNSDEVRPFMDVVTKGLDIPEARLKEVEHHYEAIGGRSPYNEHTFDLAEALSRRIEEEDVHLPVYVGMKNWHPFFKEVLPDIKRHGHTRGLGIILAPLRSNASFNKYVESLQRAIHQCKVTPLSYEYLRSWHDHPQFISAQSERVGLALRDANLTSQDVTLLFCAHSIPVSMARACRYQEAFEAGSRLAAESLGAKHWTCAYQSRSGRPEDPWLGPDVSDALRALCEKGVKNVLLVPIGFTCDNAEVLFDLDVEAREEAVKLGMRCLRASTVMSHPDFVDMLVSLIWDQLHLAGTFKMGAQSEAL